MFGTVPQAHGLGMSLLQRLCQDYAKLGQLNHIANLRTNYRCHKDLMQLSSDLFYRESKLIPTGRILLHPEHKYPLEFICSDVRTVGSGVEDTNEHEADILLTELQKLIRSGLPKEWSKRDICIMAPSRRQVHTYKYNVFLFISDNCCINVVLFHFIFSVEYSSQVDTEKVSGPDWHSSAHYL